MSRALLFSDDQARLSRPSLRPGDHLQSAVIIVAKIVAHSIEVKNCMSLLLAIVFHHLVFVALLHAHLNDEVALCLARLCLDYIMVVTVRAVLVGVLELADVLAEDFFAFFASKNEFHSLLKLVVFTENLFVAFRTVEPPLAAGRADCYLSIHNVFAHFNLNLYQQFSKS